MQQMIQDTLTTMNSAKLIMAQLEGKSSKDSKTESNIGCTTHQGETLEGLKISW